MQSLSSQLVTLLIHRLLCASRRAGLDEGQRGRVAGAMFERRVAAGEVVIRCGRGGGAALPCLLLLLPAAEQHAPSTPRPFYCLTQDLSTAPLPPHPAREGDEGDNLYVVARGRFEASKGGARAALYEGEASGG